MKILVVDDDPHILQLYKEELQEDGYEVVTASNGAEAMEVFEKENPDLVTLDILMPDIDGITVLRRMKELRPRMPIIMSTAYDYRDDFAVWASEAYLVKSADLSEMKSHSVPTGSGTLSRRIKVIPAIRMHIVDHKGRETSIHVEGVPRESERVKALIGGGGE